MKHILPQFKPKRITKFLLAALFIVQTTTFPVQPFLTQEVLDDLASTTKPETPSGPNQNDDSSVNPNPDPDQPTIIEPDSPVENFKFSSDLIIKAVNPGYTVDQVRDVGELIEIQKLSNVTDFSLAGYSVRYTNSRGTSTTLLNFSEGSLMTGEFLLMRLARSPGSDRADATYMTTLAMSTGKVELLYHDTVIDEVCWSSQDECYSSFKSAKPTTLVRNFTTGAFEHLETYDVHFDPDYPTLFVPPVVDPTPETPSPPSDDPDQNPGQDGVSPPSDDVAETPSPVCYGLEFSEVFAYYADDATEQFIELYNPTERTVTLNACTLRYKKKTYPLAGAISPGAYSVFRPSATSPKFTLTKNPNTSNTIELLDADGSIVDVLVYYHGQKKSTAFAKFYDQSGDELWRPTYAPTPAAENVYQEFRSCAAGKVINPATGNCVKATTAATEAVSECPAGKYRNPLTGRCKKIETATEPKPCAEGYERNSETNRCRKVTKPNDGASYALVPETHSEHTTFVALGVVILLVILGAGYVVLQFRHELARAGRKARQRLHHVRKHLFTRGSRPHRDK